MNPAALRSISSKNALAKDTLAIVGRFRSALRAIGRPSLTQERPSRKAAVALCRRFERQLMKRLEFDRWFVSGSMDHPVIHLAENQCHALCRLRQMQQSLSSEIAGSRPNILQSFRAAESDGLRGIFCRGSGRHFPFRLHCDTRRPAQDRHETAAGKISTKREAHQRTKTVCGDGAGEEQSLD